VVLWFKDVKLVRRYEDIVFDTKLDAFNDYTKLKCLFNQNEYFF